MQENAPRSTTAMGITSLVLGIIALLTSLIPIVNNVSAFIAVLGVVFAIVGIVACVRKTKSGKGVAIAGLVLSVVAFAAVLASQSVYSNALENAFSGSGSSQSTSSESGSVEQKEESAANVSIDGCETAQDYAGGQAIVVTLTWTNNSDKEAAFFTTYSLKPYVNGQESQNTFGTGGGDWYDDQKSIKPGATQTFKKMYEWDGTSAIEVDVKTLFTGKDIASKTFTL